MINGTISSHRVPAPSSMSTNFVDPDSWPAITCQVVRGTGNSIEIKVTDPRHNEFGKLDVNVSQALAPIMDAKIDGFRLVVRIPLRLKGDTEISPGQPCSDTLRSQITLYGPRRAAEMIGKRLASKNLWLVGAPVVEAGFPVCNPHADQRRLVGLGSDQRQGRGARASYTDTRTVEEATSAISKMFDSLATSDRNLPYMEPLNDLIVTPLLDHQKQALWFLTEREKSRKFSSKEEENTSLWRREHLPHGPEVYREIISGVTLKQEPPQVLGGLLADMMGLGKTIEILALIASTITAAQEFAKSPLIRTKDEQVHHLRNARTTLLISPLSAVKNWEDQMREHLKSKGLTHYTYHGSGRTKNAFELANYDIVVATYGTVTYELSRQQSSPLSHIRWFRIVLDEAHTIREQKTKQSQVIYNLWATRRWAVTGTPIQNRLEDLGSLVKFLRLYPYSDSGAFARYIKAPVISGNPEFLKSLRVFVDSFTLRRLKDEIDLPKREDLIARLDFSNEEYDLHEFFRKESNAKMQIITQRGRGSAYAHMLRSITTMRLVSAHGKDLLNPRDKARLRGATKTEAIDLDEMPAMQQITKNGAYEILEMMVDAGFNMCMRCSKPIANDPSSSADDQGDLHGVMFSCFDILCVDCFVKDNDREKFDKAMEAGQPELGCPRCKAVISSKYIEVSFDGLEEAQLSKEKTVESEPADKTKRGYNGPHTKTKALLHDLAKAKEQSKSLIEKGEHPIKSVVFSEFTSHLNLIGRALKDNGHIFTRIDGTMSLPQRRKVLNEFSEDPSITVLLASIKAAGQGLNLTSASRAFIMEPLWNPAAEQQAVDRVHRLGQTRDVVITRYLMNNSIEVKIRGLQEAKQKMADISMNRNHKALSNKEQREESIKMLRSLFK